MLQQRHVITGSPTGTRPAIDHADIYALEMAMAWIDDGVIDSVAGLNISGASPRDFLPRKTPN